MAIANSYPKATPKADDLILGTVTPTPGSTQSPVTRNFEIDALADLIISETSGITGSGTLNTIAMFTPTGSEIGDSIITQSGTSVPTITIGPQPSRLTVDGDLTVANRGSFTGPYARFSTTTVVEVDGDIEIGGAVRDTNNDSGTDGQLLVSNAQSNVEWKDPEEVISGSITKLIPFQVTASAGASDTYSADNNIVEFSWTGGNGTYVFNIPSAATIPYRNIRFVTNSTFPNGASDKVQITAQSGETIDGAAFFEISKQYEGVSLWSNGTEWIVIQAKAH